jgi:hypothetical protein
LAASLSESKVVWGDVSEDEHQDANDDQQSDQEDDADGSTNEFEHDRSPLMQRERMGARDVSRLYRSAARPSVSVAGAPDSWRRRSLLRVERLVRRVLMRSMLTSVAVAAGITVAQAQGLEAEGAIEAIVGSDVKTDEARGVERAERVLTAIENSLAMAGAVRKSFNLNEFEIVVLQDPAIVDPRIPDAVKSAADALDALRLEIESSAMFYHAINSNGILLRDVIGLEFDGQRATVFVMDAMTMR